MLTTQTAQAARGIVGREREYGDIFNNQGHFSSFTYDELEARNLEIKKMRLAGVSAEQMRDYCFRKLEEESGVKAVSVSFTDLEGRLQVLDYDKKFILGAHDNLTFDGSSIQGFTELAQSDLRLTVDWSSFRWLPADVFGPGKVMVFANVCDQDGSLYISDFRGRLHQLSEELREKKGMIVNLAPEIEGFLFKGKSAEQDFDEKAGFELVEMSSYFNCLPQDTLRLFIDKLAEVQRALGFENEKDHPEVAPSQFEVNYRYSLALDAADQIQLYKLCARQLAKFMGLTASFLPKPFADLNGNGMHSNISLAQDDSNIFYDANGREKLSETAWKFITGVLYHAKELCLVMNASVNSYRRLDPNFEAPNEIKVSSVDRGSMIRLPLGNAKSARIEVRTVAPDANPYMNIYTILRAGLKGVEADQSELSKMKAEVFETPVEKLPGSIGEAISYYEASDFMKEIMGEENFHKYGEIKKEVADRSPRELGTKVKNGEVIYHHEVRNQQLWSSF